ncbi:MAG: aspartate carbamoyltransferase catalytic subunit [Acidimicrobiia bacterium]|nr:aspartate carbamoyltransferase catalytic subunit [Acidimicrobiia bacterium]MYC58380.1 aspartate carbamoyltransferase catalytic subunit [Acidimicrobiia bacterium]MYG94139.1 aspartate carbamoyltransferase catalytic subunit [Acidimicrobiia bacterium]MYI30514.1 aspartate carbamoyltransferase catalytic subunit [Acidimicrobiia bacterium]
MRHLLSVDDLSVQDMERVFSLSDHFTEVSQRPIPKVPALRGKTVAMMFFEDSTRTRLSFEAAARRLSADVMCFSVSTSAVSKGESLRDTVATLSAMGTHAMVVRHRSAGVPQQVAAWSDVSVVNAGDGWHEHPTQALLDCYTIRDRLGTVADRHIVILGDVKHSRVARSCVKAFVALDAKVTLVAPATLLPPAVETWPVDVSFELDSVLSDCDVVYGLRVQTERQTQALLPSLREYTAQWGLTVQRANCLGVGALVMHPGPVNRGVEIAPEVLDRPNTVLNEQVRHGVSIRMAVLYLLLGAEGAES